jgi:predicted aspartyl protease
MAGLAAGQPAAAGLQPASLEAAMEAAERGDPAPAEQALQALGAGDEAVLLRGRLAAAGYQGTPHRDPELARIALHGPPGQRRAALTIISSAAFAAGDYRIAASAAGRLAAQLRAEGNAEGADGAERTQQVAAILGAGPGQSVDGPVAMGSTPLRYDEMGLPRIAISLNAGVQDAVVDTGANLSVLSAETARRLAIPIHSSRGSVGNAAGGTVPVRTGVAERLTIAGTTLRNVPFLIIDDAELTFAAAGGYRIQAIIGLPVLRALQRIRMDETHFAVEAPQPFDPARQALHAAGNDLFLRVQVGGEVVPLLLDTGANRTLLTSVFAAAHPQLVSGLSAAEQQVASAGGQRRTSAVVWRDVSVNVGGRSVTLPSISIALPAAGANARNYGTVGSDVLRRLGSYAIDFRAMRVESAPQTDRPPAGASAPSSYRTGQISLVTQSVRSSQAGVATREGASGATETQSDKDVFQ